jgi:hypothetical protein
MYGGGSGTGGPGTGGASAGGGFYNKPITQPFSQPYSVGSGGNGTPPGGAGNAGGNTNLTNVGTVNGGSGNTPGNQPGASLTVPVDFRNGPVVPQNSGPGNSPQNVRAHFGAGAVGFSPQGDCNPLIGNSGAPGAIIIFENTGT